MNNVKTGLTQGFCVLERAGLSNLAYVYTPASTAGDGWPVVMFCGGYRADMKGTKALYLEEQCKARGQGYIRFDYAGHGDSEGTFDEGRIGSWAKDAQDMLDHVHSLTGQPVLLVGSSMGGWMALLAAKARPEVVCGVVGIAAAPDFSEDLFNSLSPSQQKELMETGHLRVPNDYSDEPYHYTRDFYEEAKAQLLLHEAQDFDRPISLIHGLRDRDVPASTPKKIQAGYPRADVRIHFVEDGDHRLSRPQDLVLIDREVQRLSGLVS